MNQGWTKATRDKWFYGTLLGSTLSVLVIFWPFLDVLVYGAVVATVASPVHAQLMVRLGGRRTTAAVLTTVVFSVLVGLPVVLLLYRFALEGMGVARAGLTWVAEGGLERQLEEVVAGLRAMGVPVRAPGTPGALPDVTDLLVEPLRQAITGTLSSITSALPSLMESIASGVIDVVLFVFTVVTFLAEGPRIVQFIYRLTPLDDDYEARLVEVFREFSVNMVVGAFLVAAAQGVVATVGYALFGAPRALFFGVITGLCSFVPLVGTAVVAVPMSVYLGFMHGWGWGLGLLVYAVLAIGTTDNVLRPLVIRGSSKIHPLLIFLAVFGGMSWFGLTGVILGPVIVAFFLALVRIHDEQLGWLPEVAPQPVIAATDQPSDPSSSSRSQSRQDLPD